MRTFLLSVFIVCNAAVAMAQDVEKRDVTIWSDGVRMAGDLYLPKGLKKDAKLPAVLFCAGTSGTKKGTPQKLAPRFAQAGFVFLAFDYRVWGESDSRLMSLDKQPAPDAKNELTVRARAIRWQMDFANQAMDIRAAISFLAGEPNVDPQRIGIMGSSYGGGLVAYHVLKGMTHYGIYREGFEEATRLELDWFTKHLKSGKTP